MKKNLLILFCIYMPALYAQRTDSIFVHLYTDSLKKGTLNYINIDGKLSNGRYIPLDSSDVHFSSSAGRFSGNNLYVDPAYTGDSVKIRVQLKNSSTSKEFIMYIKKSPDNEVLPSVEELLRNKQSNPPRKRRTGRN